MDKEIQNPVTIEDGDIMDYSEMMRYNVFIGEYPFDAIMEGIEAQFQDYINIEDDTDYVEAFYNQMEISLEALTPGEDENDDHMVELRNILENYKYIFVERVYKLINQRLTISIPAIEDGGDTTAMSDDDIASIIHQIYDFFILNARANIKRVISVVARSKIDSSILESDDDTYYERLKEIVGRFSPRIIDVTPTDFLKYCNATEIIGLYDEGLVAGNFLRNYSPKLYQNDEFEMEIIRDITIASSITNIMKDDDEQLSSNNV